MTPRLHKLSATSLYNMYVRMLSIPCSALSSELGLHDSKTGVLDKDKSRNFIQDVAYEALGATHVVLYNKAQKVHYLGAPPTISVSFPRLPVYMSTLINTIGPVRSEGFLLGGWQVPYLDEADVKAVEPVAYGRQSAVGRLASELHQGGYETASVGMLGNNYESNGWWTLWAARTQHPCDPLLDPFTGIGRIKNRTIWAPLLVGEILKPLQLALSYAGEPLCDVGLHSTTPWYEAGAFVGPLYDDPKPGDFPAEARAAPYFCGDGLVYHEKVESTYFAIGETAGNKTSVVSTSGRMETNRVKKWRIVYHCYVHIVCLRISQDSFPGLLLQKSNEWEAESL